MKISAYLFDFASDGAALLDACRVLVQIEDGRVVVPVADLDAERAETGQGRAAVILGLHRHAVVRHADLRLAVEDVRRPDESRHGVNLEPVDALVARLHQRVGHVPVRSHVQIDRFHLTTETFPCNDNTSK